MAKNNNVRNIGPIGLRGIRNSDLYPRMVQLAALGNDEYYKNSFAAILPYDYLQNNIEATVTPQLEAHGSPWNSLGTSRFDTYVLGDDPSEINLARADRQSTWEKWGSSLVKGVTTAGTTFIDGTLGLIYGVGRGIVNMADPNGRQGFLGGLSYLWDNEVSNGLLSFNKIMEEMLPYYHSNDYQDMSVWEKMGTADFWADGVLKNMGFMVGAVGSGMVGTGVVSLGARGIKAVAGLSAAAKAAKAMESAGKATKTFSDIFKTTEGLGTMGSRVVGSMLSATNEARIEANQTANDWERNELAHLRDSGLTPEEQQSFMADLQNRKAKVGAWDFFTNLPILMADDFLTYGKLYSKGFSNAKDVAGQITKEGEKEASNGIFSRLRRAGKEGLKAEAEEAGHIAMENGKYVAKELTAKDTWGKLFTTGLREGNEEMAQQMAANFAGNLYATDSPDAYKNAKFNGKNLIESLNYLSSLISAFNSSYGDGNQWEQFAVGAVSSLLGSPTFGARLNSDSSTILGKGKTVGWSGGILGEIAATRAANEEAHRNVDVMNLTLERLKNARDHFTLSKSFTDAMDGFSEEGDKFEYLNASDNLDFASIQAFANSGRLDDLKKLVNIDYDKMDEQELCKIATFSSPSDLNGNATSGWVDSQGNPRAKKNEDGTYSMSEDDLDEMRDELKLKRDNVLKQIDAYAKAVSAVRSISNNSLDDEQNQELAWLLWKLDQFLDRYDSIKKENEDLFLDLLTALNSAEELIKEDRTKRYLETKKVKKKVKKKQEDGTEVEEEVEETVVDEDNPATLALKFNSISLNNIQAAKSWLEGLIKCKTPRALAALIKEHPEVKELFSSDALYNLIDFWSLTAEIGGDRDQFVKSIQQLIDTYRLAGAAEEFNNRFNDFVSDPTKITKANDEAEEKATAQKKAATNVNNKDLVNESSVSDLVALAEEGANLDELAAFFTQQEGEELEQLEEEGLTKIKKAKEIVKTKGNIILQLDQLLANELISQQEYDDAVALLNQSSAVSLSVDELTDLTSFSFKDTSNLSEGLEDSDNSLTEELVELIKLDRAESARLKLLEAINTVKQAQDDTDSLPDVLQSVASLNAEQLAVFDLSQQNNGLEDLLATMANHNKIADKLSKLEDDQLQLLSKQKADNKLLNEVVEPLSIGDFKVGDKISFTDPKTGNITTSTITNIDNNNVTLDNNQLIPIGLFLQLTLQEMAAKIANQEMANRKLNKTALDDSISGRDGSLKGLTENERAKAKEEKKKKQQKADSLKKAIGNNIPVGNVNVQVLNAINTVAKEIEKLVKKGIDVKTAIESIANTKSINLIVNAMAMPKKEALALLANSLNNYYNLLNLTSNQLLSSSVNNILNNQLNTSSLESSTNLDSLLNNKQQLNQLSTLPVVLIAEEELTKSEEVAMLPLSNLEENKEAIKKEFEELKVAIVKTNNNELPTRVYWKPATSEIAFGTLASLRKPFYIIAREKVEKGEANYSEEDLNRFEALYKYMKSKNAWNNAFSIKKGDTVEFIIDESLKVGKDADGNPVFTTPIILMRVNGKIVGDLPCSVDASYNSASHLAAFSERLLKEYKQWKDLGNSGIFVSKEQSKVDRKLIGLIPYSETENTLNDIHTTTTSTGEETSIPFKIGILIGDSGTRILMTPGRTKSDGPSAEEGSIMRSLSGKSGLIFLLMPTGSSNNSKQYIPVPISIPLYTKGMENTKLGQAIDRVLNSLASLKKGQEIQFIRDILELLYIPEMHVNIEDGRVRITVKSSGDNLQKPVYSGRLDNPGMVNEIKEALYNTLFLISRKYINTTYKDGTSYNEMIGEVATCNLDKGVTHPMNSWFTINPVNEKGDLEKTEKPKGPTLTHTATNTSYTYFTLHLGSKTFNIRINNETYIAEVQPNPGENIWESMLRQESVNNLKAQVYAKNNSSVVGQDNCISTPWGNYNTITHKIVSTEVGNTSEILDDIDAIKLGQGKVVATIEGSDAPILLSENTNNNTRSESINEVLNVIKQYLDKNVDITSVFSLVDKTLLSKALNAIRNNGEFTEEDAKNLKDLILKSVANNSINSLNDWWKNILNTQSNFISSKNRESFIESINGSLESLVGTDVVEKVNELARSKGLTSMDLIIPEIEKIDSLSYIAPILRKALEIINGYDNIVRNKEKIKEELKKALEAFLLEEEELKSREEKNTMDWDTLLDNNKDNVITLKLANNGIIIPDSANRDAFYAIPINNGEQSLLSNEFYYAPIDINTAQESELAANVGSVLALNGKEMHVIAPGRVLKKTDPETNEVYYEIIERPKVIFLSLDSYYKELELKKERLAKHKESKEKRKAEYLLQLLELAKAATEEDLNREATIKGILTTNAYRLIWNSLSKELKQALLNMPKGRVPSIIYRLSLHYNMAKKLFKDNVTSDDIMDAIIDGRYRELTTNNLTEPINIEKEIKWLEKVLPLLSEKDRLIVINSLISIPNSPEGRKAWGRFKDGIITLSRQAAKGTLYHEAFHSVVHTLLNNEEVTNLFDAARLLYGDLNSILLEEKLAEDFRKYVEEEETPVLGTITRFFRTIKHLVKSLFGKESDIDNLFYRILRGKLANRLLKIKLNIENNTEDFTKNNNTYYREIPIEDILKHPYRYNSEDYIDSIRAYNRDYALANRYREMLKHFASDFKEEAKKQISTYPYHLVLYAYPSYGKFRIGITKREEFEANLAKIKGFRDNIVDSELSKEIRASLELLDEQDSFEEILLQRRREAHYYNNLSKEELEYLEDRKVSKEDWDKMTEDEKENLLACML